jgi:Fibronectin type III domain
VKGPKEGDEQRQSAIDFEDEIQDYVYVRNDNGEEHVRPKRQIPDQFPEDEDTTSTKIRQLETTSRKNFPGQEYYEYFYEEITNISQTTFELKDLKHYTNYQIILRACREKSDPELEENCSSEAQIYALTMKKEENDIITVFDASKIQSNGSSGSIRVSWKPPENPNGLILTYTIRYRKHDTDHQRQWESHCIQHKSSVNNNNSFYIIQVNVNSNCRSLFYTTYDLLF